jgi:hypothetical protein
MLALILLTFLPNWQKLCPRSAEARGYARAQAHSSRTAASGSAW